MTDRSKSTKTLSLRVSVEQAEHIRAAATAAHLPVSTFLYLRAMDRQILSTPRLAALAELISTLRRLESLGTADAELLDELRRHVVQLSQATSEPGELA